MFTLMVFVEFAGATRSGYDSQSGAVRSWERSGSGDARGGALRRGDIGPHVAS